MTAIETLKKELAVIKRVHKAVDGLDRAEARRILYAAISDLADVAPVAEPVAVKVCIKDEV